MDGIPELDIYQAIHHFTGGGMCPNKYDEKWQLIQKRLDDSGSTGGEFCHFILYHLEPLKKPVRARLRYKNLLATARVFDAFLKYKEDRIRNSKDTISYQIAQVKDYVRYGYDLERMLHDNIVQLNSVSRLEWAFRAEESGLMSSEEICKLYRKKAFDLLLGCPEMIILAPRVRNKAMEGFFDGC